MIIQFICRAILLGVPLLYGSTGEIVTEKAGHLNLGIPGIMYVGAISGVVGSFLYENSCGNDIANMNPILAVLIPLACTLVGSMLMGLIYSFLTVTLHANQNVTGLALTTFGVGFGDFFGGSMTKLFADGGNLSVKTTADYFKTSLPIADKLGWFGEIFLSYGFLAYLAVIIAILAAWFLKKTKAGLHLRAVGENPATADAAGINVTKYKYLATCIGGDIAGLGGLYFIMDYTGGSWTSGGFGDRGWLAIALVIFTVWKPNLAIIGSIIFGALYIVSTYIQGFAIETKEIFKMLPYIVTVIVLLFTSIRDSKNSQPPQSLGLNYFREER